ncbi:hypothetical protein EDD11_002569 [Mortierella claussenii]|nr:hypothetical protein EDD11_002569 [Mortierella claussenii]
MASLPVRSSPVFLPEIVSLICSYLDNSTLAVAAGLNKAWSQICLPLLYRDIVLGSYGFKMDSLELGILRHGHLCQRFKAVREANHWCSRIVDVLRCTPNLRELDATWMNVDLLDALVSLQRLERLVISRLQGSQSEENPFFEPSFRGSSQIRQLHMADSSQMTDSALVSITRTSPFIEVLVVSGNQYLTHEGLIRWCQELSSSSSSSSSSLLCSLPSSPAHEQQHQQQQHYQGLNQNQVLNTPITRLSRQLNPVMGWTRLTQVNFKNCNRILSAGFQALFERSQNLQHVDLMSTRVDDEALETLAFQNKGLKSIVLNCCAAISDRGLQAVLRNCHLLEAISFLYCSRVTVQVFFQTLWKCLGLNELRFSLNSWHLHLIEHGLEQPGVQPATAASTTSATQDTPEAPAMATSMVDLLQPLFYEPHLELTIFGGPETDPVDIVSAEASSPSSPASTRSSSTHSSLSSLSSSSTKRTSSHLHPDVDHDPHRHGHPQRPPPTSIQEYRQRLILAQLYRQIEQFTELKILDMRNIHRLPINMISGLGRLGRLRKLQDLEWTGLDQPLGPSEIDWLTGIHTATTTTTTTTTTAAVLQTSLEEALHPGTAARREERRVHGPSLPNEPCASVVSPSSVEPQPSPSWPMPVPMPMPMLQQLVFKGGYSLSSKLLKRLKAHRPQLNVQLTQVKDAA